MLNRKHIVGALIGWVLLAGPALAAVTATVTLNGQITGTPWGSQLIAPPPFTASAAIGQTSSTTLTAVTSTYSITVPSGATAVLLTTPAGNTAAIDVVAGGSGTTGVGVNAHVHFGAMRWAFLPLASGATLAASASAASTVLTHTFF